MGEEIKMLHAEKEAAKHQPADIEVHKKKKKGKWYELKMPPRLQKLLDRLTGGMTQDPASGEDVGMDNVADLGLSYTNQPRYAMSNCIVGSSVTYLVAATYYNPTIPQLLDLFTDKDFMVVAVSTQWIGKKYGELFEYLIKQKDLLSVALYRQTSSDDLDCPNVLGVEGSPPPAYVFTAPPLQEILIKNDRLLCMLSDEKPWSG